MYSFSKTLSLCLSLLFCLALVSCSGGSKPASEGDFTLASTPAVITLVPGAGGQQISVNATAANGFTGAIAVVISGLPAGVTAQPATLTVSPGTAQNLTLTAGATAVAGSSTLTLTGTSGALSHSSTIAATISAPPPPPARPPLGSPIFCTRSARTSR